jgi:membrane-associated PAP2 superfamily phosphatase
MPAKPRDTAGVAEADDERALMYRRRYREARRAGLTIVEAQLFASSRADIGQLRRLVAADCPPDLIRRIML